jgi:hypothetical protein
MIERRFDPPLGKGLGESGYSIQVPVARRKRDGGIEIEARLFNGRPIHVATFEGARDKERLAFGERAAGKAADISADQIEDILVPLVVHINDLMLAAAAEATARKEKEAAAVRMVRLSLRPPGFVCVALGEDANAPLLYVLRTEAGTLRTAAEVTITEDGEEVTLRPPRRAHLKWVLPRAAEVQRLVRELVQADEADVADVPTQYARGGVAQFRRFSRKLLADLEKWLRAASDLEKSEAYLLLALYILLTYAVELVDYLAIILLQAEPERGKSRAGQAAAAVARHGMHHVGIREANLLRDAGDREATLFIDVMNVWEKAERHNCEDILLGRFERGAVVERVLRPEEGPFADTAYFPVYGPTIIATNVAVHDILGTRCLRIDMPRTRRRFAGRLPLEAGRPLIERLMAWRAVMLGRTLPECAVPTEGRLGDILRPLGQVLLAVAPERRKEFEAIVKWQVTLRQMDLAGSLEAAVLKALWACRTNQDQGHLLLSILLDVLNKSLPADQQKTAQWLSRKVRAMSWKTERWGKRHAAALIWDDDLLRREMARYGLAGDEQPEERASSAGSAGAENCATPPSAYSAQTSATSASSAWGPGQCRGCGREVAADAVLCVDCRADLDGKEEER